MFLPPCYHIIPPISTNGLMRNSELKDCFRFFLVNIILLEIMRGNAYESERCSEIKNS